VKGQAGLPEVYPPKVYLPKVGRQAGRHGKAWQGIKGEGSKGLERERMRSDDSPDDYCRGHVRLV